MIDPISLMDIAQKLHRESLDYGIPAVDVSDGLVMQVLAYMTALRGGKVAVDAGAGIGYSTLWIASGMEYGCVNGDCKVIAIEYSRERASRIISNLSRLGLSNVELEVIEGDAISYIKNMNDNSLDYAFIDVEKEDYPLVIDILSSKLKRGGIALFHNAFFPKPPKAFFDKAYRKPWRVMISPTPAGLLVAIKEG